MEEFYIPAMLRSASKNIFFLIILLSDALIGPTFILQDRISIQSFLLFEMELSN